MQTFFLRKLWGVKMFFAAREAGIRGIRVMRSEMTTYFPLPLNGGYGEEVLRDSSH